MQAQHDPPRGLMSGTDHQARDHLSRLVQERRTELGLSVNRLAALTGDPTLHASWILRLERGDLREIPKPDRLDALARGLKLAADTVREAAGAQFLGITTVWDPDHRVRTFIRDFERLSEADQQRVRDIVEMWARDQDP